ncbi:MAG: zinc ribbon domain-containing protein [Lachnospiraceae bacterium]|nr:zinc ribbon domain-containing protein [Lachnospiraceae bacterium]
MKCSKCGSDFPNDVNYCPYCGEQIWKCNTERSAGDGETEKLTSSLVKLLGTALGVSVLLNLKFLLGKDQKWSGEETKGFEDILKAIRSFGTEQNAAERKAAEEEAEAAIDRAVLEAEKACEEVGSSVEEAVKSFTSSLEGPFAELKKSVEETAEEIERSFNEIMAEAEKALSEEEASEEETAEAAAEAAEEDSEEPEEEPEALDKGIVIEIDEEPEAGITVISFPDEPDGESGSDEEESEDEDSDEDDTEDEEESDDEDDLDDDEDSDEDEDDSDDEEDLDDEEESDEDEDEDDTEDEDDEEDDEPEDEDSDEEDSDDDIDDEDEDSDDDLDDEDDESQDEEEDSDEDEDESEDDDEEIEKAAEPAEEEKEETKRANPFAFLFNPFRKAEKEPEPAAEPEEPEKSDEPVEIKIDFGEESEADEEKPLAVAFGEPEAAEEPAKPAFDSIEIEKEDFAEAAEPEIPIEGFDEDDPGVIAVEDPDGPADPITEEDFEEPELPEEPEEPELPEEEEEPEEPEAPESPEEFEEPELPDESGEPEETSHLINIDFGDEEAEESAEEDAFEEPTLPEDIEDTEAVPETEQAEEPELPEEPEEAVESEEVEAAPGNNVDELLSNWSFAPEAKAEPADDEVFRGDGNADKFGSFVEAPLDEYVMTAPEGMDSEEEPEETEPADGGLSLEDILSEGAPQQTADAEDFLFNSLFDDKADEYPQRKQSPLYADAPTAEDYESVKMDAEEPISLDTMEEETPEEPAEDDFRISIHSDDYDVDEDEEEFFGHDEPSGTNEETFDIDEHLMNLRKEAEEPAAQDNETAAYSLADLIVSGYEDEPDEEDTPIDF